MESLSKGAGFTVGLPEYFEDDDVVSESKKKDNHPRPILRSSPVHETDEARQGSWHKTKKSSSV